MPKDFYFKIYAAETLDDEDFEKLELEAQAIVFRIWCVLCRRGRIEPTATEIARLCMLKPKGIEVLHLHLQNILQMFSKDADGMLYSERLELERAKSGRISEVRSKAAKSSHNNRKKRVRANAPTNTGANDPANDPAKTLQLELESKLDKNPPNPPSEDSDEIVWQIAKLHPKNDKLKSPAELSSLQEKILVERIAQDGAEVIRTGTEALRRKWMAKSDHAREFMEREYRDPYLFWKSYSYRELAEAEKTVKPRATAEDMMEAFRG